MVCASSNCCRRNESPSSSAEKEKGTVVPEPLRGILTGLGGRGRHWLAAGQLHPDVTWVGYVEPFAANQERAIAAGAEAQRVYASLAQAIDATRGDADFVLDVTPPATHEEIALEAFRARLHVIGEKPLSDDFAAARRMVVAGKQANRRHMITQNYRFGPQPRTTRRLIGEGLIGPVSHIDVAFYMSWADSPGSHYVTQPFMFTKDMGIHHFDMIRYVLGQDPVSARCVTWNPSWGWHVSDGCHVAIFTFADNTRAVHRGVGAAVGTITSWNGVWRIEGPLGTITWEGPELYYTHLHRAQPRRRELIFPDDVPAQGGPEALLTEFVAAVREGREPECHAADNIRSLAMVEACVRSAQAGGIEVPLEDLLA